MWFTRKAVSQPPIAPTPTRHDVDAALRPVRLADFTGQQAICNSLQIACRAAAMRGEAVDHTLFFGPPGLGKTTLANIVANEMRAPFVATSGPVIKNKADMYRVLAGIAEGTVLFIDEIHALSRQVEEMLYPAMEDFTLDVLLGERTHTMRLPRFTLVGATTRQGQLNTPLLDRFGLSFRLNPYQIADLVAIIKRSADKLRIGIDDAAAADIARRSRGTPRIANKLLRRCRDDAQVNGTGAIAAQNASVAMDGLGVDRLGLEDLDRRLLASLASGGPMGLNVLAASVEEEPGTVADTYEPYLTQIGFMERTARGRAATQAAKDYLVAETRGGLFAVA